MNPQSPGSFRLFNLFGIQVSVHWTWFVALVILYLFSGLADSLGCGTFLLNFNQGAMPHDMYMQNLERFGKEVLPALQAHKVSVAPV